MFHGREIQLLVSQKPMVEMSNAIGLQNPGMDVFIDRDLPFLQNYDTKVIVNVCGKAQKILWKWWNDWLMNQWICWKLTYHAPM